MSSNVPVASARLKFAVFTIVMVGVVVAGLVAAGLPGSRSAYARDLGQWQNTDPQIARWFRALAQPDTYPPISCCGEADAYLG
jgi:hypothetical protein